MASPKPQPTALKKLHGRPGHHRMNRAEPVPPGALDEPPAWLTVEQAAGWRYALDNAPPGLLRRLDRGVLTIWVVAEDMHRRAAQLLERHNGESLMMSQGEQLYPSSYLSIMSKQAMLMLKAVSELGFSPSARVRVYAQPTGALSVRSATGTHGPVVSLAEYIANAPPRPLAK
jgi:P27 family predicted phage terminase small subunit